MFEITVIENLSHTVQMFHMAVADETVDQVMEEIYDNETIAVRTGTVKAFTVISEFQRYNQIEHYQQPYSFTTWKGQQ